MGWMRLWVVVAGFLFVAAAASVAQAEQVDNPAFQAWTKFNVGSTVTLGGKFDAGPVTVEMETTETLLEKTADHITIQVVSASTVNGQHHENPPMKKEIPAKEDIDKRHWKEVGEETIQAMGKSFKCKVIEGTHEMTGRGGATSEAKATIWFCPEVPGAAVQVKVHMNAQGNMQAHDLVTQIKSYEAK